MHTYHVGLGQCSGASKSLRTGVHLAYQSSTMAMVALYIRSQATTRCQKCASGDNRCREKNQAGKNTRRGHMYVGRDVDTAATALHQSLLDVWKSLITSSLVR